MSDFLQLVAVKWAIRIGVVLALALITYLWRTRISRRARKIERVAIDAATDGMHARVVGRAIARGGDVLAPYSGRTGLAVASATVRNDSDRSADLPKVSRFALDDGTGVIELAPDHVRVELALLPIAKPADAPVGFGGAMLKRNRERLAFGKVRYLEAVVEPGEMIAVAGLVRRGADGVLRLVGERDQPLLITTAPGAVANELPRASARTAAASQ